MAEPQTVAVPPQFLEEAGRELVDYFVGFCVPSENDGEPDAKLAGSGTLVTIDKTYGILTADHVIQCLPSAGDVGLVLPRRSVEQLHRMTIRMEFVRKVRVGRGADKSKGPDLALLVLPPSDAANIQAFKSFCNLARRRDQVLSHPQSTDTGVWYLCGMAHEWTADSEPYGGYGRVKRFRGLYALTKVISEWQIGGFDYLEVGVRYDANYQGPQSFQGFSGGGLWQLLIAQDHASGPRVVDRILSGVAFYQSALEGDIRRLTCHGRRSIYGPPIDLIRKISIF